VSIALAGAPVPALATNYVICRYPNLALWASAIVQNGRSYYAYWNSGQEPTWAGGSNTITHRTNVKDFDESQIGVFCESTGEVADVYGSDYEPTLTNPCDAIVKVRASNSLNPAVLGIITGPTEFANLGDVLCVVDEDTYNIGDILVPSVTGLCRKGTNDEKISVAVNGLPRVRVTAIFPDHQDFVACFLC
jgi:hypothetical protein